MTPERLNDIRGLEKGADPGNWSWRRDKSARIMELVSDDPVMDDGMNGVILYIHEDGSIDGWWNNMNFLAESRAALRDLLKAYDELLAKSHQ